MFINPEKACLGKIEREEDEKSLENLKEFLGRRAEQLKQEGVPVRSNCRIEMDDFGDIYPPQEIEGDKKEITRIESNIGIQEKNTEKQSGEKLEMLKTGIFNKFLSDNLVIVRASRFDDIKNGVDNVMINRQNGSVVCALDEVGEIRGVRFEDKKEQVLKKNHKGGINLKYALTVQNGQIKPGKAIDSVPIFYLALSPEYIQKGIQEFVSSADKPPSDYERKIFDYFISSLDAQIKALELNTELKTSLKERMSNFKTTISQVKQSS